MTRETIRREAVAVKRPRDRFHEAVAGKPATSAQKNGFFEGEIIGQVL